MKHFNILSLLLLASAQIYGNANPELSLICAYQAVEALNRSVASDNDDAGALKLLETMDECISFDINNKKSLAATNGMLFKTPLDQAKIDADIKSLQSRINTLDHNMSEFKKGGIMPSERTKINNRKAERRTKIQAANEKQQALKDSQIAMDAAQKTQSSLQESLAQNELLFEQALESYILSFGQCYIKQADISILTTSGTPLIGLSTIIASKYDKDMPITPKEYKQLITVLNKAYSTFGASATITLDLDIPTSLQKFNYGNNAINTQQVANYIQQIPLGSSQSWAMFGAKAALGIGAAILATAAVTAAVAVGSNLYQKKNWDNTEDALDMYNAGMAQGAQTYNDVAHSAAAQSLSQFYNNASDRASNAWENVTKSSAGQNIYSFWNSLTVNQQAQAANELQNNSALTQTAANALINNDKDNLEKALLDNDQAVIQAAQEQLTYGQKLLDEIEYQMENYGKPQLTAEENSKLAPYAAGALALGIGGIGAAIAADVIIGTGATLGTAATGVSNVGTFAKGTGQVIAEESIAAPLITKSVTSAPTGAKAVSPTWANNFSHLPEGYIKTAPLARSAPVATKTVSPNWAAYFEHLN